MRPKTKKARQPETTSRRKNGSAGGGSAGKKKVVPVGTKVKNGDREHAPECEGDRGPRPVGGQPGEPDQRQRQREERARQLAGAEADEALLGHRAACRPDRLGARRAQLDLVAVAQHTERDRVVGRLHQRQRDRGRPGDPEQAAQRHGRADQPGGDDQRRVQRRRRVDVDEEAGCDARAASRPTSGRAAPPRAPARWPRAWSRERGSTCARTSPARPRAARRRARKEGSAPRGGRPAVLRSGPRPGAPARRRRRRGCAGRRARPAR